jgi:L-seryl-tRNA(Ser) seleniumtransferase
MTDRIIRSKRDIPSVEILASDAAISSASESLPRPLTVEIIRAAVSLIKEELDAGLGEISYDGIRKRIIDEITAVLLKKIGRVINGTGILVHTNLGRAPLSEDLFDKIKPQITGYGNLEFDVVSGRRGKRGELAEKYLALVSGADAGTIVNNNAAALFIILNTLANRRKVLVSRGALVKIGGGFRIPDIIQRSGAKLVEVGTTNITALDDYRRALEQNPAVILKVHKSNFIVAGFTEEVELKPLISLGNEHNIPVINDLGSGVLVDTAETAGIKEPTVQGSVRDGAALTCFSGDKLLGGVQAGLIVGRRDMVAKVRKNPVYRVVRVDKIVFSAVEELLGCYLNDTWKESIKLWRLALVGESELYERGRKLLREIDAGDKITLEGSHGFMGGGALPEVPLPSVALVFNSRLSPQKIAAMFRRSEPPVIGRVTEDRFTVNLKAVDDDDAEILVNVIKNLIDRI